VSTAPTAGLLVIGNEVLSGRTQDANIRFLAIGLGALGIPLREVRVIPDVAPTIVGAVNEMRARFTWLFTTGGIGPTHDDITSACIAEAFGVPCEPHPQALRQMEAAYPQGEFNAARRRMATMPRGATLIENDASPAPGFTIGNVHVMAGVPRIMQAMFRTLEGRLPRGLPILSRSVHAAPMREGAIAGELGRIQQRFAQLDIGSYPYERDGSHGVAIVAKGTDQAAAEAAIDEVTRLIARCGYAPVAGEPEPPPSS
jgi:molybdopterin-biosynthesis enzyme MoeA-like protein